MATLEQWAKRIQNGFTIGHGIGGSGAWVHKTKLDQLSRVNKTWKESREIAIGIRQKINALEASCIKDSHGKYVVFGWGCDLRKGPHPSQKVILKASNLRGICQVNFDWVEKNSVTDILCTSPEDLALLVGKDLGEKQKETIEKVLKGKVQCYPHRQDLVDKFFSLQERENHAHRVSSFCREVIEAYIDKNVSCNRWYDQVVIHLTIDDDEYYLTSDRVHGWAWIDKAIHLNASTSTKEG